MYGINSFLFGRRYFNDNGNAAYQGKPRGKLTSEDTVSIVVPPKNYWLILHAFVNGWREVTSILANSAVQWQQTGRAAGWGPDIQTGRAPRVSCSARSDPMDPVTTHCWALPGLSSSKMKQSTAWETDTHYELKCDKAGTIRILTSAEHSWSQLKCWCTCIHLCFLADCHQYTELRRKNFAMTADFSSSSNSCGDV